MIYLRCCGEAFPAESSSDFPVIVLSWWAEAVLRLQQGATKREERATGAADVRVQCTVLADAVVQDVRRAANDLLVRCQHERWFTDDWKGCRQPFLR